MRAALALLALLTVIGGLFLGGYLAGVRDRQPTPVKLYMQIGEGAPGAPPAGQPVPAGYRPITMTVWIPPGLDPVQTVRSTCLALPPDAKLGGMP